MEPVGPGVVDRLRALFKRPAGTRENPVPLAPITVSRPDEKDFDIFSIAMRRHPDDDLRPARVEDSPYYRDTLSVAARAHPAIRLSPYVLARSDGTAVVGETSLDGSRVILRGDDRALEHEMAHAGDTPNNRRAAAALESTGLRRRATDSKGNGFDEQYATSDPDEFYADRFARAMQLLRMTHGKPLPAERMKGFEAMAPGTAYVYNDLRTRPPFVLSKP